MHASAARAMGVGAAACMGTTLLFLQLLAAHARDPSCGEGTFVTVDGRCEACATGRYQSAGAGVCSAPPDVCIVDACPQCSV